MTRLRFHPLDGACYAAFLAYSASASLTPVALVVLLREFQADLTHGGFLETARNLIIFLVLFASGFVAARWGKPRALGGGAVVLGAGLAGFAVAPSYGILVTAAAIGGLGAGLLEGLINPMVQALHPEDSGRHLNLANAFWSVGVLGTTLLTGELLARDVSWRAIAGALAVFSVAVGLLFLVLAPSAPATAHPAAGVGRRLRSVLAFPGLRPFAAMMLLAGGVEGGLMFWSASLVQLGIGAGPREGGIATACFAAGMIFGRLAAAWWVPQHRLRELLLGSSLAGTVITALIFLTGTVPGVYAVLLLSGLAVACLWPTLQSYAAEQLPVDSTLLFIVLSCAGIPGFALAALVMGWVADHLGLAASFALPPVMFAGLAAFVAANRRRDPQHPPAPAASPH